MLICLINLNFDVASQTLLQFALFAFLRQGFPSFLRSPRGAFLRGSTTLAAKFEKTTCDDLVSWSVELLSKVQVVVLALMVGHLGYILDAYQQMCN
jgi:hypothetical protein